MRTPTPREDAIGTQIALDPALRADIVAMLSEMVDKGHTSWPGNPATIASASVGILARRVFCDMRWFGSRAKHHGPRSMAGRIETLLIRAEPEHGPREAAQAARERLPA